MLSNTPEAVDVANPMKKSEMFNKSHTADQQQASARKIVMNGDVEMKEPETLSKATKDKLDETYTGLEKWKHTALAQIRSLKVELFEDTQLWRQNIASTTIQEIVDSLEESLVGVFADVENLKTTARELFKMIEKQAEVTQLLCNKALSDKDSKELQSQLKQIWPKYSGKSPTPTCFSVPNPPTKNKAEQATPMDWEKGLQETTKPGCVRNQEINRATTPSLATDRAKSRMTSSNEGYDVTDDIRRRLRKYRDNKEAPGLKDPENHFGYLRQCWHDQINLPLSGHQKKNIWSFKHALVATGYDRVVLTWQGMFYEVSEADIELGNLLPKQTTGAGVRKWVSEGVTVFKWDDSFRHVLRPHRFAMRPYNTSRINWRVFKPHKYYIHVYQTKIERSWNDLRTLSSRSIAQHLRYNWNAHYWPRPTDIKILHPVSSNNDRNTFQWNQEADRSKDMPHSQSKLSSVRRTPIRRRRRRRQKQLDTESSCYVRGEPRRSGRTEWWAAEPRQNIATSLNSQSTRRREMRTNTGRWRERHVRKSSHTKQNRPNDLADLLDAIQQVSKDVNILKRRLDFE